MVADDSAASPMKLLPLATVQQAVSVLKTTWPVIVEEARAVLGGELHYQAVAYHCMRLAGVPRLQLGMNVKQWIEGPISPLFQSWDVRKHEAYRGGFEPIPDLVVFNPEIAGDWRRRQRQFTLRHMLLAVEIKASERAKARLGPGEITRDIQKLAAHREEVRHRGGDMHPVMMVLDTAPLAEERMRASAVEVCRGRAASEAISFLYAAREGDVVSDWADV